MNQQRVSSNGNIQESTLSNGQRQLQQMLSNNMKQMSPSSTFKNKQTNTSKSHQRGSSVNIQGNS